MRSYLYKSWLRSQGRGSQLDWAAVFQRRQFDSRGEVEAAARQSLTTMLQFARENVPFYSHLLNGPADASAIEKDPLATLRRLPLLDKTTLKSRFDEFRSIDIGARKWYENRSGGSTGAPAKFLQDVEFDCRSMATAALFDTWAGHRLGGRKVVLWGSERDLMVGRLSLKARVGQIIRNEIPLNAFRMAPTDFENFVETINRTKPAHILGYVDGTYELARHILRNNIKVHSPKGIITSAGTLHEDMRNTIERAFKAPVLNRYGSREVGCIACECGAGDGLHINPFTHHIEILGPDGRPCPSGETGEIVVTLLSNYAMPLLRYRIGDVGSLNAAPCSCGRHWPLLKAVDGRTVDIFTREDGGPVSPIYFLHFFGVVQREELGFIDKFQLVQEGINQVTLNVVSHLDASAFENALQEKRGAIESVIQKVMGGGCQVTVNQVNDIPKTPSGKYRYTMSKVERK